jgi:hypothetical protein
VCENEGYEVLSIQGEPELNMFTYVATGHMDALVANAIRDRIVLEVKCPRSRKAVSIRDNGCPPEYAIQAAWYAMISGADHAEVIVWDCDAWDYLKFTVKRDEKLEALMRDRANNFAECIARGERPTTDGFESAASQVPVIGQRKIPASGRHYAIIAEMNTHHAARDFLDEQIAALRAELMASWPADAKALTTPDCAVTLSEGRKVTTTDIKKASADHPEINWASYQRTTQGAPFIAFRKSRNEDKD